MPTEGRIRVGEWVVEPAMNRLQRGGEQLRLEPRHMDLLVYFARHPGRVVSTDDIMEEVWSGVLVGDHSIYQGVARLRKALGDDSQHPHYIETVAKRGYRLIAAVERVEMRSEAIAEPGAEDSAVAKPDSTQQCLAGSAASAMTRLRKYWLFALLPLLAISVLISVWLGGPVGRQASVYETLAVLPFENLEPESADTHFAEGLSLELIDTLGHIKDLHVVGQVSSFSILTGERNAAEIGRILGADVLVEGSVRRFKERVRIFIQLVDAETGYQIWSETYEQRLVDVFYIQKQIAQRVAEKLQRTIEDASLFHITEAAPASIAAYDYYLLGQHYRNTRSRSGLERALALYQKAEAIDPEFAPAYQGVGKTYLLLSFYGDLTLTHAAELAEPFLAEALKLDPEHASTLGSIGLGHYLKGEYGLAEHYLERAVTQNPNYSEGWMWRGLAVEKQGRLREALDNYREAALLEPLMVTVQVNYSNALSRLGGRSQAVTKLEQLAVSVRNSPSLYRELALLALERSDLSKAYEWTSAALDIGPDEAPSIATMALVLARLGQTTPALEWADKALAGGAVGRGARELLELVYLNTGAYARLQKLAKSEHTLFKIQDVPEIDWRRMNAHEGMADLLLGRTREAIPVLEKALEVNNYAIVSTDFDLLYCTSLAFAYRVVGNDEQASEWQKTCQNRFDIAQDRGWKSHLMGYMAARLSLLDDDQERALAQLEQLVANGFSGFGYIANDPVFENIRGRRRFRDLLAKLQAAAAESWKRINGIANR